VIAQLETLPSQIRFPSSASPVPQPTAGRVAAIGTQVLDLEALAKHRGSLLGDLPDEEQPTQKTFDSELAVALQRFDPRRIVYVESESKKIGTVHVPDALLAAMRSGDCIRVDTPLPLRIAP
jgi:tRNA 2-selenouridine synthase